MKKIVCKKVNIILIVLLLSIIILSNNTNLFIKKADKTGVLSRNYYTTAYLSPDKKRLLLDMGDNIGIFDIKRERIIHSIPKKTNQYEVYHFEWTYDNRILVVKNNFKNNIRSYFLTDDFLVYELLFDINERIKKYPLINYQRWFIQNKITNDIYIRMENDNIWRTNLSLKNIICDSSNDDRFIFLLSKNETHILDSNNKTIRIISEDFLSGKWAPNKNIYAYIEENENGTIKNFFCFYPQNLKIVQYNIENRFYYGNFLWSPNGRYILLFDLDKIYLIDVLKPLVKPKRIIKVKGNIDFERTEWSQDSKSVLTCYSDTTYNVFQPINYYLAKVNIETKKVRKVNLDDKLYGKVFWINENLALYELRTGLYKSEIDW